ncbi:MAG: FAD-binding oxidoreductase, partial [Gammaproteobacteria bacterium]|nr:FAD-binding oxidoreductase [Gammaproteobacteria bacterium]
MSTDSSYETTIIGGGIVGICCGLALVEAGMRVLLIDKNDPGQGASYGNAGVISPWSIVPQS